MAEIPEIAGMTNQELRAAVEAGGRFVVYEYVFSVVIMTFQRSSRVFFVPAGKSRLVQGLPYTAISMLFGWWGFPWGFIFTPISIVRNLSGGKDVTKDVILN